MPGSLFAASDLHVSYEDNRRVVDTLRPETDDDWLIVAGDVGELADAVTGTLAALADRSDSILFVPFRAGSRQVGCAEQPHRPPRAGECAQL